MGCITMIKRVIFNGCQAESRTEAGDTALMLAAIADQAITTGRIIYASNLELFFAALYCWDRKNRAFTDDPSIFN
ncbi:hypothetical protein SADUNF_Sadunf16G0293900 [Salix dunnii]|uniref:Uncharacterized protein n=1 Tax=Salix dunnii TaxID=1413687 RepID=A0A835JBI9_9ROSI|nr:hypothetical protein SADUNF_Sadunf16G0293900 [Salix dunnii]